MRAVPEGTKTAFGGEVTFSAVGEVGRTKVNGGGTGPPSGDAEGSLCELVLACYCSLVWRD